MSSSIFDIQQHTLPTSHIREYPHATANDQEEVLNLAIKQYTPRETAGASTNSSVTIIGAHANGFPKELYEPLWEDLYHSLKAKSIHIRSIWIADVAHQGASGVLNEERLGHDPSWYDHPRDLFLMVNHFRKQMIRPIIGVGHSMGGNNLVNLSLMHPRLFTTLILVDPVIQRFHSTKANYNPAQASTSRREIWPSRKAAGEKMAKSKFYQTWDRRVLDRWIQYGLRDLPTYIHPVSGSGSSTTSTPPPAAAKSADVDDKEVTLTTTRHQEVFSFLRPNFPTSEFPNPNTSPNRQTHPDVDAARGAQSPFYRPEPPETFSKLPFLRPSVFYVFGDPLITDLSASPHVADKMAHTGTGTGGSGGVAKGRVGSVVFHGVGHLIPMEVVDKTAQAAAGWIEPELERWRSIDEMETRVREAMPKEKRGMMSEEYQRIMKSDWVSTSKEEFARESKL